MVGDHLGTPRMLADRTGSLAGIKRHDYMSFGEEIPSGVGPRSAANGYAANDNVRQGFTQKERDDETGLDYFGARYYANSNGRFTGADPWMGSAHTSSPQTWNRYTYTLNNPLRYVDQDGRYNEDVHYWLTRLIAMAVGFRDRDANIIAFYDQRVDLDDDKQPMPTLATGAGVERRRLWHFTTPERRQELWNKFLSTLGLDDLGWFLHTLQDSYSHRGLSPDNGQMTCCSPWNWADADDTWRDVPKADDMGFDTYHHLYLAANVMQITAHGGYEPMGWTQISDLVHSFNASSTDAQKQYFLQVLESRVKANHDAQDKKEAKELIHPKRKKKKGEE
jgi:RHS repeat-associated protein